jgi:hypothetical protein
MCCNKKTWCLHELYSLTSLRIATNLVRSADTTDIMYRGSPVYIQFLYLQHVVSNEPNSGCKLSPVWINVPARNATICMFYLGTLALPLEHMHFKHVSMLEVVALLSILTYHAITWRIEFQENKLYYTNAECLSLTQWTSVCDTPRTATFTDQLHAGS